MVQATRWHLELQEFGYAGRILVKVNFGSRYAVAELAKHLDWLK